MTRAGCGHGWGSARTIKGVVDVTLDEMDLYLRDFLDL
jgi:hypothetical protein